jgi:hypothetical protein
MYKHFFMHIAPKQIMEKSSHEMMQTSQTKPSLHGNFNHLWISHSFTKNCIVHSRRMNDSLKIRKSIDFLPI